MNECSVLWPVGLQAYHVHALHFTPLFSILYMLLTVLDHPAYRSDGPRCGINTLFVRLFACICCDLWESREMIHVLLSFTNGLRIWSFFFLLNGLDDLYLCWVSKFWLPFAHTLFRAKQWLRNFTMKNVYIGLKQRVFYATFIQNMELKTWGFC